MGHLAFIVGESNYTIYAGDHGMIPGPREGGGQKGGGQIILKNKQKTNVLENRKTQQGLFQMKSIA